MIVVFNRLNLGVFILVALLYVDKSQAEEITWFTAEEKLEIRANAHCSAAGEFYQQCFTMDLVECSSVYQSAFNACDQLASDKHFDEADQSAVDQFSECYQKEFENYLESKGLNLDEECNYQ
ncbi:MAG: hypothetical protein KBT53_09810 [Porticoccus sp.]|nr:hypothetical protein [Porticoccus sp.]